VKPKVLFIDAAHPLLHEMLEQMGYVCHHFPMASAADILAIVSEYEGVVVRSKIPIDRTLIDQARRLRFVARVGAGMENIDVSFAALKGIVCLNAPEGNRDAVGEHALGMLLALFNKLHKADREVRAGIWKREENRGTELGGKTVAIIGYGNTGSAFARLLLGFDAKVLAYDKYKTGFGNANVVESTMEQIFAEADVLSLHVPLTDETTWLVDRHYIDRFNKNFSLINTSRGKVVKTEHLVAALESGKVRGACLDVIEYEQSSFEALQANQIPNSLKQLIAMENVVLSPHIAGWTYESNIKMAKVLAEKIKALRLH
jgi:D-3-phosphoglycerate dehydrogenase / 2-oxoglutarate reductase